MPPADSLLEDFGALFLKKARQQQQRNKIEAEKRLADSAESRFPRPASTNWLRVITGEKSHLVIFASRDWKILARERTIRTGSEWKRLFGFGGPKDGSCTVAHGLQVGFEVTGNRETMLGASRKLLAEVVAYEKNPPEVTRRSGTITKRPKPRKPTPFAWPTVLPPLIAFLEEIQDSTVKIFNHHR